MPRRCPFILRGLKLQSSDFADWPAYSLIFRAVFSRISDDCPMMEPLPHVDEILTEFFSVQLEGESGLRQRRIERLESVLREFLETEGPHILIDQDSVLLAAEREFRHDGAFARTMHAGDIIFALPTFVAAPWLHGDRADQRTQVQLAEDLARFILEFDLIDRHEMVSALWDLRSVIDTAKKELKSESAP